MSSVSSSSLFKVLWPRMLLLMPPCLLGACPAPLFISESPGYGIDRLTCFTWRIYFGCGSGPFVSHAIEPPRGSCARTYGFGYRSLEAGCSVA